MVYLHILTWIFWNNAIRQGVLGFDTLRFHVECIPMISVHNKYVYDYIEQ